MTSKEIQSNFALLELGIRQEMALHPGNLSETDINLLNQIKDYVNELEQQNEALIKAF